MTRRAMPDERLLGCGWEAKQRHIFDEPDFVYRKPGTYGWFDGAAAREYEQSGRQQYPTDLMPSAEGLGQALRTKPGG